MRFNIGEYTRTHGMTGTKIHNLWKNMRGRCYRESSTHYGRYGGRGIKVCDSWNNSFEDFYKWAILNNYSDDLTIDRIDVDGNYQPSNCRFITSKENTKLMNEHHLLNETGGQSFECREKIKHSNRKRSGKETVLISPKGEQFVFLSRGEAVDFLVELTGRKRASLKAQLTACYSGKSQTISEWSVK